MVKPRVDTLTQEELKKWLTYCPNTGIFQWTEEKRYVSRRTAGALKKSGYVYICLSYVDYLAHRLAWLYVYGTFPQHGIDHINGVKSDNRIDNLRDVGAAENGRNCKMNKNNTSGYRGVTRHPSRKKWRSRIVVDRKIVELGDYDTKEKAFEARLAAEKKYGFHPNHGRIEILPEIDDE